MTQSTLIFTTRCVLFVTFATTGFFTAVKQTTYSARCVTALAEGKQVEAAMPVEKIEESVEASEESQPDPWIPFWQNSNLTKNISIIDQYKSITTVLRRSDILAQLGTVVLLT